MDIQITFLVPMACAIALGLPISELQAIPTACIYNPGEDVATLATWSLGAVPVNWLSMAASLPLAARAADRLHKYKTMKEEMQKLPPPNGGSGG